VNITHCGKTVFEWGKRTYVMGIVNVSPDSFSGDGAVDIEAALAQAAGSRKKARISWTSAGNQPVRAFPR